MIVDARSLPEHETIETDVCIVGAGVAGITLARELKGYGFRVCVLEAGGLGPDRATQALFWGENVGLPYYALDTAHSGAFGGTSHRWLLELGPNRFGARTRPLDAIDFEERDWVPYSGWPFDRSHLDPYFERAQSVFKLGPYVYSPEEWNDPEKQPCLPFANGRVETVIFQFGGRDTFIHDYRAEIEQTGDVITYLYANVVEIETSENAQAATRLRVACLQGNSFWVSARLFILAMSAIETPRLMLLSNRTQSAGLGNQHDLVGRFFMEHLHLWSGIYIPSDPGVFDSTALYRIHTVNGTTVQGKLALSEEVQRRERLLNYVTSIHPSVMPTRLKHPRVASRGYDSLKAFYRASRRGRMPEHPGKHLGNVVTDVRGIAANAHRLARMRYGQMFTKHKPPEMEVFLLNSMSEQAPNPDSRVTLSDERDALGRQRVCLDWQLTPLDVRTVRRAQQIIDEELRRAGLGRLHVELDDDSPPPDAHGGWHHMGTTRMHVDPRKGVVDKNCLVHGMSNLFIAAPSVFPTGGYANPVLSIIALSLRLADHVKSLMS